MALCENKGIPMVIKILKGNNLLPADPDGFSDPYVKVTVLDQINESTYMRETLNPFWNENLLYIIPFNIFDKLIKEMKKISPNLNERSVMSKMPKRHEPSMQSRRRMGSIDIDQEYIVKHQKKSSKIMNKLPKYFSKKNILDNNNNNNNNGDDVKNEMEMKWNEATLKELDKIDNAINTDNHIKHNDYISDLISNGVLSVTIDVFDKDRDIDDDDDFDENKNDKYKLKNGILYILIHIIITIIIIIIIVGEDDFLGHLNFKINMVKDNSQYPPKKREFKLIHKNKDAGTIELQLYLQILQTYQDFGIQYIDEFE